MDNDMCDNQYAHDLRMAQVSRQGRAIIYMLYNIITIHIYTYDRGYQAHVHDSVQANVIVTLYKHQVLVNCSKSVRPTSFAAGKVYVTVLCN